MQGTMVVGVWNNSSLCVDSQKQTAIHASIQAVFSFLFSSGSHVGNSATYVGWVFTSMTLIKIAHHRHVWKSSR